MINYDAFSIYLIDAERKVLRHRFSVRYDQRVTQDNILGNHGRGGGIALSDRVKLIRRATRAISCVASGSSLRDVRGVADRADQWWACSTWVLSGSMDISRKSISVTLSLLGLADRELGWKTLGCSQLLAQREIAHGSGLKQAGRNRHAANSPR